MFRVAINKMRYGTGLDILRFMIPLAPRKMIDLRTHMDIIRMNIHKDAESAKEKIKLINIYKNEREKVLSFEYNDNSHILVRSNLLYFSMLPFF